MTERIETEDSGYLRLLKQFGEAWDAADVDKFMSMRSSRGVVWQCWLLIQVACLALGGCSLQANLGVSEWSCLFRGLDTDFEIRGCDIFESRRGRKKLLREIG